MVGRPPARHIASGGSGHAVCGGPPGDCVPLLCVRNLVSTQASASAARPAFNRGRRRRTSPCRGHYAGEGHLQRSQLLGCRLWRFALQRRTARATAGEGARRSSSPTGRTCRDCASCARSCSAPSSWQSASAAAASSAEARACTSTAVPVGRATRQRHGLVVKPLACGGRAAACAGGVKPGSVHTPASELESSVSESITTGISVMARPLLLVCRNALGDGAPMCQRGCQRGVPSGPGLSPLRASRTRLRKPWRLPRQGLA